jgi:3-deoxy-D-manno-octulosonic-acid transferase
MSKLLTLYERLCIGLTPLFNMMMKYRLKKGWEPQERFQERMGVASHPRPSGKVVWFHGASVGESLCALPVIHALVEAYPSYTIVITTVTECSAMLLQKRLPPQVIHQYAPIDHPYWVQNFLNHWRPDISLWIESELWPNLITSMQKTGKPMILINAKISKSSVESWKYVKNLLKRTISTFDMVLAQNKRLKNLFESIGGKSVHAVGNLKTAADPLPVNQENLKNFMELTASRPLWLAASTHKIDEEFVLKTHEKLKKEFPNLLTIMVPRHIERGPEIITFLKSHNKTCALRSHGEALEDTHEFYVADTLGELGLFFRLAPITFIGAGLPVRKGLKLKKKSLGGHNPWEAALLGCAILLGPDMRNNQDAADRLLEQKGAFEVKKPEDAVLIIQKLLKDEPFLKETQHHALTVATTQYGVLNKVMHYIKPYLENL